MAGFVKVGEYGFNIDIESGQDLSSHDTFKVYIKDPSGNSASYTASRVDNDDDAGDSDDIVRWSVTDVFDEDGVWTKWATATDTGGTMSWISDAEEFLVKDPGDV